VWLWIWDEMFCTKLEGWLVHAINPGCFCFSFQRASAFDVPLSISLQSPFFLSGFGCIFCGCGESCVGVLVQIELHSVLLQQETHCTRGISLRPPSKPAGFSLSCCSVPERRLLILCSRLQEHLLYPTDSRFSPDQLVVQERWEIWLQ